MSRAGLYLSPFSLGGERRYAVTGVIWKASLAVLVPALVLGACAGPGDDPAAAAYDRIYVQSLEVDGVGFATTRITLYGELPADLTDSLAESPLRPGPYVDYPAAAASKDVFYIRVTGDPASQAYEGYAIRVLALATGAPVPVLPAQPDPGDESLYEEANDADPPWSSGEATVLTLDVPIVRYLEPSNTDVDWFKIELP